MILKRSQVFYVSTGLPKGSSARIRVIGTHSAG